jgi:sec-independent protein translocase protein TatA
MPGTTELLVIGGIVILLFGAASIPKLARSLGQAKKEFEKGSKDAKTKDSAEPEKVPEGQA